MFAVVSLVFKTDNDYYYFNGWSLENITCFTSIDQAQSFIINKSSSSNPIFFQLINESLLVETPSSFASQLSLAGASWSRDLRPGLSSTEFYQYTSTNPLITYDDIFITQNTKDEVKFCSTKLSISISKSETDFTRYCIFELKNGESIPVNFIVNHQPKSLNLIVGIDVWPYSSNTFILRKDKILDDFEEFCEKTNLEWNEKVEVTVWGIKLKVTIFEVACFLLLDDNNFSDCSINCACIDNISMFNKTFYSSTFTEDVWNSFTFSGLVSNNKFTDFILSLNPTLQEEFSQTYEWVYTNEQNELNV